MRLPKFWPRSGVYNDHLVSLCITSFLIVTLFWGGDFIPFWPSNLLLKLVLSYILSGIFGLIIGVTLAFILETYFRKEADE